MPPAAHARDRLLDAALRAIRANGYAATSVDGLCRAAGVTKGAFFHHFASKEALALAAAAHFAARADRLFAAAPIHAAPDPADRVRAYVDFRASLLTDDLAGCTCLLGTMVQEAYASHPALREACAEGIFGHAGTLVADIAAARARHAPDATWSAESLAEFTQAVLQGAFVLAKAKGDPQVARASLAHLRRYIDLLFPPDGNSQPAGDRT